MTSHDRRQRNVPFNVPLVYGTEADALLRTLDSGTFSGNGPATRSCCAFFQERIGCELAILTPSCTAALEMSALLCELEPGDEVIMPSYSFVTTATAFALRGVTIKWCDIRRDTKNLDENQLASHFTARTKAVVVVHYGGVGCEMDTISEICHDRGIRLIEDAAQSINCTYKGKPLGSLSDLGTLSFHDTKNIHCGEGGALLVNDSDLVERAEIIRDKGTNRSRFLKGLVDKYTWVDLGSSFLMSELQASFLSAQLSAVEEINSGRLATWNQYSSRLSEIFPQRFLPQIPDHCVHNGHVFPILADSYNQRERIATFLKDRGIQAHFHFLPLHLAPFWRGRSEAITLPVTEEVSDGLIRLPLFSGISADDVNYVCDCLEKFALKENLSATKD